MDKEYEYLIRVMIIGDANVGKSSLILRYCHSSFKENIQSTVGLDYCNKYITLDNEKILL